MNIVKITNMVAIEPPTQEQELEFEVLAELRNVDDCEEFRGFRETVFYKLNSSILCEITELSWGNEKSQDWYVVAIESI